MRPVVLSDRLRAAVHMVTAGNRVCDVGCDHGFVPIYLIEQGISPRVLAMDVGSGPLSAAREHISERGLESKIETRLSDGLHNYSIGEADTLICAGMGGRLMMRILTDSSDKTESFQELILQPQSELEQFRAWLRSRGYRITHENMIEEDGKFYPMMRVETHLLQDTRCNLINDIELCKLTDRYGPFLLAHRNSTLGAYLKREERIYEEILDNLKVQGLSDVKRKNRYEEVHILLEDCRRALDIMALK